MKEKMCPYQPRRKDGVVDINCQKEKCMAWGVIGKHENATTPRQYRKDKYGCKLIQSR